MNSVDTLCACGPCVPVLPAAGSIQGLAGPLQGLRLFYCLLFDTANTVYMLGAFGPLNTRAQFSTAHAMSDCDCAQRLLHKCLCMGLAPLQTHTTLTDRAEKLSLSWRTVMAPRFHFGFQHCREGVRALSGAGMGLSETPEPIATHNDLCVSSWRGHMPPVGSSYSQQSSHRRVSSRSRSCACLSTSWRL